MPQTEKVKPELVAPFALETQISRVVENYIRKLTVISSCVYKKIINLILSAIVSYYDRFLLNGHHDDGKKWLELVFNDPFY